MSTRNAEASSSPAPVEVDSHAPVLLKRPTDRPLLAPRPDVPWEKDAVLNAAVVHDGNTFHMLYRAVAHNPGDLNRSSIGYACSGDGMNFQRRSGAVLSPGGVPEESKGCEDPRVIRLNGEYHMTYTAWDETHSLVSRAVSADLINWRRCGPIMPYDVFGHNKNAALFPEKIGGRHALLHRPMGFGEFFEIPASRPMGIMLSRSDDLNSWTDHTEVMTVRPGWWDERKIGIAGPPIETSAGWLLVYHGVDMGGTYRLGLALLDRENPARVLKRQAEPILEPQADWERRGDVPNVVFSCGGVLLGDELWVYYGGADTVIGLARGSVREFLRR